MTNIASAGDGGMEDKIGWMEKVRRDNRRGVSERTKGVIS